MKHGGRADYMCSHNVLFLEYSPGFFLTSDLSPLTKISLSRDHRSSLERLFLKNVYLFLFYVNGCFAYLYVCVTCTCLVPIE